MIFYTKKKANKLTGIFDIDYENGRFKFLVTSRKVIDQNRIESIEIYWIIVTKHKSWKSIKIRYNIINIFQKEIKHEKNIILIDIYNN